MNSSLAFPRSLILPLIYLHSQLSAFLAIQLSQPYVLSQLSAFPAIQLSQPYVLSQPSALQLSAVLVIYTILVMCSQPCALSVVAVVAVVPAELSPHVTTQLILYLLGKYYNILFLIRLYSKYIFPLAFLTSS